MLNRFKKIALFSVFYLLMVCPTASFAWHGYYYGDWNYHGSGRDHPYSDYINQYYGIGYADYALIQPDFVDWPSYINNGSPPAIVPLAAQTTQIPAAPATQPDEFTVNIPNDRGGYTAVVIKRSGNGFIGPQGEFYPEFPKVSQLKVMYGK